MRTLATVGLTATLLLTSAGCGDAKADRTAGSEPSITTGGIEFRRVVTMAPLAAERRLFLDADCEFPDSALPAGVPEPPTSTASEPVPNAPSPLPYDLVACDRGFAYRLAEPAIVGGVESATATAPEGQIAHAVLIVLTPEAADAFARLSLELASTHQQVAVVVDGEVVTAPAVQSAITDGRLQISGDFTESQAADLAERITG